MSFDDNIHACIHVQMCRGEISGICWCKEAERDADNLAKSWLIVNDDPVLLEAAEALIKRHAQPSTETIEEWAEKFSKILATYTD